MKKKILRAFSAFILLMLLFVRPVCAQKYKRIISLAPSVTESLYELGLEKEIAGISVFCPKGKYGKEIIGTILEPDIEKIVLLKPELIISTKEGNSKSSVEKLQRLGFDVFVMETSGGFKEICANFAALAVKVEESEKAQKLIKQAEREVLDIYSEISLMPAKQSVFWEVGAKPLYTAGRGSFVNDYNYYTRTANIYGDTDIRYPCVSIEDVISRNPDIIIMVNMGDISFEEINVWKKYDSVSAVKNGKIHMLDADDIFTPTPAAFAKGLRMLARTIFPELFNDK